MYYSIGFYASQYLSHSFLSYFLEKAKNYVRNL
nr:MAG TPA: hypothetical protein [Caudoviricetes sp.]